MKFRFLVKQQIFFIEATEDCERVVPPKLSSPEVLHCVEQTALRSFEQLGLQPVSVKKTRANYSGKYPRSTPQMVLSVRDSLPPKKPPLFKG